MIYQSQHTLNLPPAAHGLVARYAVKNHIMMDSAIYLIFIRGLAAVVDEVLEPVQVRSGIPKCQPTVPATELTV